MAKTSKGLSIDKCQPVPLEGLLTLRDIEYELKDFVESVLNLALKLVLIFLMKCFFLRRSACNINGTQSSSKSCFVDKMLAGYSKNDNWEAVIAAP